MKPDRLFAHWKLVRRDLLWTMDQFHEGDLTYRPFEESWTVGEILLHIANSEQGWFQYAVTGELEEWPAEFSVDDHPTLERMKELLTEVHDWTEDFITDLDIDDYQRMIEVPWGEKISLGWILWHVLEHEIHHRGELSLILGLLGREGLDV